MSPHDRIAVDPEILDGKLSVKGTRLTVSYIVERLADRWTWQQLIDNYPGLTDDDISACLRYAADAVESKRTDDISLAPAYQLAFCNALNQPPNLTPTQQELGKLIRGES